MALQECPAGSKQSWQFWPVITAVHQRMGGGGGGASGLGPEEVRGPVVQVPLAHEVVTIATPFQQPSYAP